MGGAENPHFAKVHSVGGYVKSCRRCDIRSQGEPVLTGTSKLALTLSRFLRDMLRIDLIYGVQATNYSMLLF